MGKHLGAQDKRVDLINQLIRLPLGQRNGIGALRLATIPLLTVLFWILWYGQYLQPLYGIYTEAKRDRAATTGVKEWIRTFLRTMNYSEIFLVALQLPFFLVLMQGIAWLVIKGSS